jgi:hypothetical protein
VTGVSEPVDRDALRIGTQEREDAIQALGDHFAAGRLPTDEYEQRVTGVLEAQTRGQLRQFFDDLPAPHPRFMTPLRTPPPPPLPLVPVPAYPPVMHTGYSDKSRVAAGLLQILLPFGIGRFYTGHIGIAVAQLLTVFVGVGVILLTAGGTDSYGRPLRI